MNIRDLATPESDVRLLKAGADASRFEKVLQDLRDENLLVSSYLGISSLGASEREVFGVNWASWEAAKKLTVRGHAFTVTVKVRGGKQATFVAFQDGSTFMCSHDRGMGAEARSKWACKEFSRRYFKE